MKTSYFLKQTSIIIFLVIRSFICIGQDQAKVADIKLNFSEKDSVKSITASLHEIVNQEIAGALKDKEIHFYVQRTFSLFLFSKEGIKTDENGEVTAEFPSDLPGDSAGNVTIVVKLENDDVYPDTEISKTVKWGIPVITNDKEEKRSLWATGANAPVSYLILINALIAGAWVLIIFIIFKLVSISRM